MQDPNMDPAYFVVSLGQNEITMHGHCKDVDVEDGLERGIGHGRRYVGSQDHLLNGTALLDARTAHGNVKDLGRHLGRQRRHGTVADHIRAGVGDEEDVSFGKVGWLGAGRRHFQQEENIVNGVSEDQVTPARRTLGVRRDHVQGGSGADTPPASEVLHGHAREAAFQEGLERYIGHGRRHRPEWTQQDQIFPTEPPAFSPGPRRPVGGPDHIVPGFGQATCAEDTRSEQGKRHFGAKGHISSGCSVMAADGKEDYVQGLPRSIGQGKQRIGEKDHLLGALSRAEDCPGQHGHQRDDDFQDGLERGIGHGKCRAPQLVGTVRRDAARGVGNEYFPWSTYDVDAKKKEKPSPNKVLLKAQQVSLSEPAYVKSGLEPIQEDVEDCASITPPPGLEKPEDDDFSDSLWSRSTTGGSAFDSPTEDEDSPVSAYTLAQLSSLQYREQDLAAYYNMIAAALCQDMPQQTWAQPPVRNFCPWCGCKRSTNYTFCPNCGNKLDA
ncbi:unnamed protein product [Effrenium voratum]|uniref:Uncharacterized protein n=1 Tax=Effrenium voratum TaxID=2562239 RepID=A0AA36N535_9DINO|nr:unnamed protein product [Effrenium voratum]